MFLLMTKNIPCRDLKKLNTSTIHPIRLHFIWFHLWPNAYKNDKTAFSDQLLENGNTKFYFSAKEQKGYINRMDFKVDGYNSRNGRSSATY